MAEPVRSVLHDAQVAQGAEFRDDDGWLWTTGFGDPAGGYAAITEGTAMWDVYPLVKWDVRGPQAAQGVQRVFTGDVLGQVPGQVRYGAFTDEDGLLVDDGTVFKHADDHFWVFTNTSGFGEHWAAHTAGLDFSFENRVPEMPLVSVQGPGSRDLLRSLTSADLDGLRYFRFLTERVDVGGVPCWLMRTGFSGELGFELVPVPDGAPALWAALGGRRCRADRPGHGRAGPDRGRPDHLLDGLHARRAHAVRREPGPVRGARFGGRLRRPQAARGGGRRAAEQAQDLAAAR